MRRCRASMMLFLRCRFVELDVDERRWPDSQLPSPVLPPCAPACRRIAALVCVGGALQVALGSRGVCTTMAIDLSVAANVALRAAPLPPSSCSTHDLCSSPPLPNKHAVELAKHGWWKLSRLAKIGLAPLELSRLHAQVRPMYARCWPNSVWSRSAQIWSKSFQYGPAIFVQHRPHLADIGNSWSSSTQTV